MTKEQKMDAIPAVIGGEMFVKHVTSCLNKTITALSLGDDNALHFVMDDGTKMRLYDSEEICCEERYMRTDDNLADFVGAKLLGAEVKPGPTMSDEYGEHEIRFLDVKTDKGVFQMACHNEHNGCYDEFAISSALE